MKDYEINKETLAIIPIENNKSKIIEINNEFIINKNSTQIIDESCKFFGSSYEGRFNGTKTMIGISHKSPIIIEESRKIIFFPTTSPRLNRCVWISFNNIEKYYKIGINTILNFTCGKQLKIELSYGMIDNQVLRSARLESILNKRLKNM